MHVKAAINRVRSSAVASSIIRRVPVAIRPLIPASIWRRLPVHGPFRVDATNSSFHYCGHGDYLGKVLFWRGPSEFEPGTARLVQHLASGSKLFFDVGGYSGYYTLLATTTNPSLEAVCFEPVSTLRAWVGHHLDSNALRHRVTLEPLAISDKTGTARFHGTDVAFSPGGSLSHSFKSHARRIADVATTRLDDYCRTHERWPDLLKIDAEGFELEILRGATDVLNASRPTIVCEVLESDPTRRRDLQDVLEALRYRWARITSAGLTETSVLEPDLSSRKDRNYLFWPSERRAPGA